MEGEEAEGRSRPRGSAREGCHHLNGAEHNRDVHPRRCSRNHPHICDDAGAHCSGMRGDDMGGDVSPWRARISGR